MKTTFFSLFLVVCLVYCIAHTSNAAVSCGTVDMQASTCINYASGKDAIPSQECCKGLKDLASTAKTVDDKKAICRCLKAGVKSFAGVQDKFLSNIPTACHINVGFPISLNTDCDMIH